MAMVMTENQREQQQVDIPTLQINLTEAQEQDQEPGEDILILLEDEDEFHLDPNEQEENPQAVYYLQDHDEEEEEDEDDENEEEDQFNIPQNTEFLQEEEEIEGDEAFYLANRTFYTTCHKISRQNSPSYRKRPPYTFLENWLIHSVFSKSQQILLRFPVIHPKVMMTEGDFIYTPHQMATESTNESDNQQQQQYYQNDEHQGQQMGYEYGDEEEYDYYDDAFIIGDEGVMVMSASAPDASQFMAEDEDDEQDELHASSLVMDENMWMGHSRYNTNGLTLHVVNPDDKPEEDDDPMYHSVVSSNNPYKSLIHNSNAYQGQLQMVQEEEEEEDEDGYEEEVDEHRATPADQDKHNTAHESQHEYQPTEDAYNTDAHNMNLSMSPEVLNWYRTADLRPVTLSAPIVVDDSNALLAPLITCDNEQQQHHSPHHHHHQQHHAHCGCSSSSSSASSENSSCSIISNSSQRTDLRTAHSDEKSITQHSASSYQSLADILMEEEDMQHHHQHNSYGTLLPTHYQNRSLTITDYNDTRHYPQPSNTISPLMQVSVCLVDAAWVALDLAQAYVEEAPGNKGIVGFITCMFRIWKVLFLGAETMLGWGNHRLNPEAAV
ncbi:hypothetical protein MAM1_0217c08178 [Mucor ambiguus]|uniref:Uncharacterized protein n=1 Tax=Mucor ambiguus TaxID=91626 RepID=A0A0C9N234_9FUNG|nr:hypothetical protein MAM1_0217c08178 [Mucor ambiguus]